MHIDLLKDWLYTFQGQIVYGVVGSFNAPFYFGVDNSSGEVAIINDLKTDIRQQYDVSSTFSLDCLVMYCTCTCIINIFIDGLMDILIHTYEKTTGCKAVQFVDCCSLLLF